MRESRLTVRKAIFASVLSVAVVAGLAACGSSSKTDTPAGQTNSPATTTPPTTASSGGGVSY